MVNAKPIVTHVASTQSLVLAGTKLENPTEYCAAVGSLQYLTVTQSDIAFDVNRLSQFMHCPTTDHCEVFKRVLCYLAGTITHSIYFLASSQLSLHAYSDADWAGDKDDYSSTGAYIVYPGKNLISWSSRKQKGIARSSTEAEYMTVSSTASEVKWILSLPSDLGLTPTHVPTIYCDNICSTYLCANVPLTYEASCT